MNKEKLFLTNKDMPAERLESEVFPYFYVTNPHIPFYIFTPFVIAFLFISIFHINLNTKQILISLTASLAFWTIFEYAMHRYLFHWKPESPFFKKLLYTIHHGHHDYPNDGKLMLVGPVISVPAFLLFSGISYLLIGNYSFSFMAGIATCYMFYDWLHFASHNYNFDNKIFQKLKVHHMRHHYEDNEKNFAFTTLIWDIIMDTLIKNKK